MVRSTLSIQEILCITLNSFLQPAGVLAAYANFQEEGDSDIIYGDGVADIDGNEYVTVIIDIVGNVYQTVMIRDQNNC